MTADFWLGGKLGPMGHLEWTAPSWWVFVVVVLGLLIGALSLLGERPIFARLAEVGAMLTALAGVAFALARPMWVEESGRREPGRIAVLVDASRSMSVLENGTPRSAAADTLANTLENAQVDYYQFGTELRGGRPGSYDLPHTDLEGALGALSERMAGETLAGVVVISDGIDRGPLRRRYQADARPAGPPELPGPLTVFQVGAVGDLRDLAVRNVDSGGYAFVRSPFTLTAHIEGQGYIGRSVAVELTRDGSPVTSKKVTIGPEGRAEVAFDVTPSAPGRFTYSVSVPVYEDDAVPSNNTMPVVVRVVRDRIRVLQVAGAPSWDVKFLRRFLKGDPSVDLVSFFILRTNSDVGAAYDEDELSLIPFPYEQLFSEDITTFDLVIFQNFDYRPYFTGARGNADELLGNVRDFVTKDGHGFAMLGGDRSFDIGDYAGTPIAEVLPIELGVVGNTTDKICRGLCTPVSFVPALTAEGRRHPLTRLAPDPEENDQWWSRLSPVDGANLARGVAPGATVLLEHPSLNAGSGKMPVLAVREVGKGRSMALTIDSSWRWSFSEAAEGRGNQAYLRFWKNAFRWLVADPTADRVTLETARENYALGEDIRLVVQARDPGFAPLANAKVEAVLEGEPPIRLEGKTDADGEVSLLWTADRRGAQRAKVKVTGEKGEWIGNAETVFAVTTRDPELDDVAPDAPFLQWVADSAGGRYYEAGVTGPLLLDETAGREIHERKETPLWRGPWLGLWIGVSAGIAWIVRRRAGLR